MKSNDTIRMKFRSAMHSVGRKSARIMVSQTNSGCRRPGLAYVAIGHAGFKFAGACGGWVSRKHVARDIARLAEHVRRCAAPVATDGVAT